MIVETLVGTCGSKCNSDPITETQTLRFQLKGPLAATHTVAVWCSSESSVFEKQPPVTVTSGVLSLTMKPDTLCTATTLLNSGNKGQHPKPPPSGRFPTKYGTFRLNFHHFDRFELDLRGHIHVRGAAFFCLRLKLADIVLI